MNDKKRTLTTKSSRSTAAHRWHQRRLWFGVRGTAGAALAVVGLITLAIAFGRGVSLDKGEDGATDRSSSGSESAIHMDSTSRSVGKPFPHFSVTAPDGDQVTKEALVGKPSIVWFTTAACVSCQRGAQAVARLDHELGDNAFRMLIVFVDPSEPMSALTEWRDNYAKPDWLVARDTRSELSRSVQLQSLDTKFLLDERGEILNVDVQAVNSDYLQLLRETATE